MQKLTLQLTIERKNSIIITDNVTAICGDGFSLETAFQNYGSSLAKFCIAVEENDELISNDMQRNLVNQLRPYVIP